MENQKSKTGEVFELNEETVKSYNNFKNQFAEMLSRAENLKIEDIIALAMPLAAE